MALVISVFLLGFTYDMCASHICCYITPTWQPPPDWLPCDYIMFSPPWQAAAALPAAARSAMLPATTGACHPPASRAVATTLLKCNNCMLLLVPPAVSEDMIPRTAVRLYSSQAEVAVATAAGPALTLTAASRACAAAMSRCSLPISKSEYFAHLTSCKLADSDYWSALTSGCI